MRNAGSFTHPVARASRFHPKAYPLGHFADSSRFTPGPGRRDAPAATSSRHVFPVPHSDFSPGPDVTLRDLAARLGVSHSTVSRALRGNPAISAATRGRVQALARELGYRPNFMAAGLGGRRHGGHAPGTLGVLAWINAWPEPGRLRSFREFDAYWRGAEAAAARLGYRLEEFRVPGGSRPMGRLHGILAARGIVGVLIPPQRGELPAGWPEFPWARFCVVRFGYSVPVPPANVVADNHLTSGMRAYEALRRLGYRRIGFVSGVEATTRFRAGFLLKQTDDEDAVERLPILRLPVPGGVACRRSEVLGRWMEQWTPDVILSDIPEMRALLERRGLRVPRDIGLAGFSVLDGKVDSGIDQNSEEIGRVAIEALTALLNRNQLGIPSITREILVESTWRKGGSVGRCRDSAEDDSVPAP